MRRSIEQREVAGYPDSEPETGVAIEFNKPIFIDVANTDRRYT
jgi:hypothetical protein